MGAATTQKFDGLVSRILEGFQDEIDTGLRQDGRLSSGLRGDGDTPPEARRKKQLEQRGPSVFVAQPRRLLRHGQDHPVRWLKRQFGDKLGIGDVSVAGIQPQLGPTMHCLGIEIDAQNLNPSRLQP